MTAHDTERLAELLGALPPAPAAWVQAAKELPSARRELDALVARAEADEAFRKALVADLESALAAEGYALDVPQRRMLRVRLSRNV